MRESSQLCGGIFLKKKVSKETGYLPCSGIYTIKNRHDKGRVVDFKTAVETDDL